MILTGALIASHIATALVAIVGTRAWTIRTLQKRAGQGTHGHG